MRMTTTGRIVLAGSLLAVLAACGTGNSAGDKPESIAIPGETGGSGSGGGESAGSSQGGPALQPGSSAASVETGVDGTRFKLEVSSLKRGDGGLVTARFKLTNTGTESFYGLSKFGGSGTIDKVFLVDPVGKKKYLPVKDSEKDCLCSETDGFDKGESQELFATFPPIPADVSTVTVSFPTLPPLEHVALG
jgi:hypothetical protein